MSVLALLVSTASLAVGEQPPPPPPLPATGLLPGRSEPTPVPGIEPRDFETLSAPPASASFAGLGDSNTQIPPDTHGAAGGGYLMETLNTHVRVQFASDGSVAFGPTPLNLFWSPVNPDGADVFGPRVVYDPWAKRWIVAACDEAVSASSRLLVGVSRTEIPDLLSSNWYQTSIDVDPGTTLWADYPSVGFSAQWVVVQVNVRRISDGGLERSHLYVFDKAAMYAGNLTAYTPIDLDAALYGGSHVPAATYDAGVSDVYLLQAWNPAAGAVRLYRIPGPGPLFPQLVGTPAQGSWVDSPGDVDFAPQRQGPPGCAFCATYPPTPCLPRGIRVNDSRFQNVVLRNSHVWAAHTVILSPPSRASVQWWQLGLDGSIAQRGIVDDPSGKRFFAFPSIAVNKNDDVLLGYSHFEDTEYAGASYSFRTTIDPPHTMRWGRSLKDGLSCYYKDFATGRNRWGDYSATVVDPADDLRMWTLQEYAAGSVGTGQVDDRWGTWWGVVDPRPKIVVTDAWASETAPPGTTRIVFDVSLLSFDLSAALPTSAPVSVRWDTAYDGSAVDGTDYVGGGATLYFAPGETSKRIEVTINSDTLTEGSETFLVNLSSPTNALLEVGQATGTILDLSLPQVSISDVTKLEGDGGSNATPLTFQVTLSYPAAVQVDWSTVADTATAGPLPTGDFSMSAGTIGFVPPTVSATVSVPVHGDLDFEADEVFYVDLSLPGATATLVRGRGIGRIVDDDASAPGASGLSILSDSTGPGPGLVGRNRLQWVNPPGSEPASVLIRYNESDTSCAAPLSTTAPASGTLTIPAPLTAGKAGYTHAMLQLGREYCYSLWLDYSGTLSGRSSQSARPFDSQQAANRVLWKLATGASLMPAPTVGVDAVIAVSNDMNVHALQRDPASGTGGLWPSVWKQPLGLGSLAHHRVPVVPRGTYHAAFIATQDGRIRAVDTRSGDLLWSTELPEKEAEGAPAGIFVSGGFNYVLVGTSNPLLPDRFYALDPDTGVVIDVFPGPNDTVVTGELGEIYGMAAVDYATSRVYFGSRRGTALRSLWCLELGPPSDALRLRWSRDLGADVHGSPVLRGGRVYVGDLGGAVWSIPATTGVGGYSRTVGPSAVKGFVFPDRGGTGRDLYAATDTAVLGLTDDGAGTLSEKWPPIPLSQPSIVLLRPQTSELYVGVSSYPSAAGSASLLRIDTTAGAVAASVPLETTARVVGAPSLDTGYGVIHVGGEAGVLYAVQLPF